MVAEIVQPDENYLKSAGFKSELKWLCVTDLLIDLKYQRRLRRHHVNFIMKNFDPDVFGTLIVSARKGGGLYVVDGQHRVEAVREMGWDDQRVPCVVYYGMTQEQEARAFFYPQVNRIPLTPAERFAARLANGEEEAVAINRKVESFGYSLNKASGGSASTRDIDAVASVEYLTTKFKGDILDTVLGICKQAWGLDEVKLTAGLVRGLGIFAWRFAGLYDKSRLITILRHSSPIRLDSDGRDLRHVLGGKSDDAVARIIHQKYNLRLQQRRLPEWDSVIPRKK